MLSSCFKWLLALADENKSYDICPITTLAAWSLCLIRSSIKENLNQSHPMMLRWWCFLRLHNYRRMTSLMMELIVWLTFLPQEQGPGSRQPSCRLWSCLLHLFNQNSHNQLKYVSHSRKYSALLGRVGDTFKHVSSNDTCPVCLTTQPIP